METYTILSTATYVALYHVLYPKEDLTDEVPVTESHLVIVRVPAETYMEAVDRLINEGIIDTMFTVADVGAIKDTRQIAPYASEIARETSIKQVEDYMGILEPLEDFTLQDSRPVVPVVCGYDIEK